MNIAPKQTSHQPRGFVVVVVLMLLAVMSAVVVTQLRVVEGQEIMGLRSEEEVKARAIAEGCLGMMQAYVDAYARKNLDASGAPTANLIPDYFLAPGEADFDRLLDRNGTVNDTDDYQPTFGSPVIVPANAAAVGAAGELAAKHRWRLVRRDGGACLMRFEDNSDDFFLQSTLPTGTASGPELTVAPSFRDVPQRDRDRAIYLVAAGVYPALTGVDNDVYAKAHARVTLRRLFAAPVPGASQAGVFAGGTFESKNGATVCGVGGVEAGALDFKNVSCMCGPVEVATSLGKTPITTGCGTCATCAPSTVKSSTPLAPARYDVNGDGLCGPLPNTSGPGACDPLPAGMAVGPSSYRANEGLGAAGSTGNNLGDARTCNFYGKSNGELYVWDRRDLDVAATLGGVPGIAALTGIPAGVNCSAQSPATIPQPCLWDPGGNTVTCGAGESPCWKLIANLGDGLPTTDVGIGSGPLAEAANLVTGGGERWTVPSGPLPNVAGTRRFGVLSWAPDYLCGNDQAAPALAGAPSCSNCAAGTARPLAFDASATDQWLLDGQTRNENLPVPAVMILDVSSSTKRVHMSALGNGGTRPTRLTVLTNESARMSTSTYSQCCATCDCSTYSSFAPPCGTENGVVGGFAIKAGQDCILDDNPRVTGSIHCGDFVDIINNPCVTGNIAGYGSDSSCAGASCSSNVGVCFRNNARVDGIVYALRDVCGKNNSIVNGGIYTEGDVVFKNNFALTGQLYANGDIKLKNNALITFNGNGTLSNGSPGLTSFMEAAW